MSPEQLSTAAQTVVQLGDYLEGLKGDARKIFDFLGSTDKRIELNEGAHYFEDSIRERQNAADLVGAWIREKL